MPPTYSIERPDGLVRRCRRHGRLKFESRNISQMPKDESAYLERISAAQPHGNVLKHACRVVGPRRQRGRIKIESIKVNPAQKDETTHLGCVNAIQPVWRPGERIIRVNKPTFESRMPGEHWRSDGRLKVEYISINRAGEGETTYRGCARIVQPPGNNSKRLHRVHRPCRRRGRIKITPANVNRTQNGGKAYLGHANAIPSNWRPKKGCQKVR